MKRPATSELLQSGVEPHIPSWLIEAIMRGGGNDELLDACALHIAGCPLCLKRLDRVEQDLAKEKCEVRRLFGDEP